MLSEEQINKLDELFGQEERSALEFLQGTRQMSIKRQIKYYFGTLYPFTKDEDRFLDGFALIIQKNIGLISKISKLKMFSEKLSDERGFRKINASYNFTSGNTNTETVNNSNTVKEYLKHGKTRSGGTERGDDYKEVEEAFDLQDQKILQSDLQFRFKGTQQDSGIVGSSLINQEGDLDQKLEQQLKKVGVMPSWTTVTSASDRTKSRDTSIDSKEGTQIAKTDTTTVNSA